MSSGANELIDNGMYEQSDQLWRGMRGYFAEK